MKSFVLVCVLLLLAGFPLWYVTYSRYDPASTTDDSLYYVDLCHHLWDRQPLPVDERGRVPICSTAPLRYRVLTPLLVEGLRRLALHRIWAPTNFGDFSRARQRPRPTSRAAADVDPAAYRLTVYYFTLIDFLLLVATGGLWFLLAQEAYRLGPTVALLGSVLWLLTFWNVVQSLLPHSDAGAHLFVAGLWLLYTRNQWGAFAATALVGVFQKETILLVIGLLLATELLRRRWWAWKWLAALLPALVAYRLLWWLVPLGHHEQFEPSWQWLVNLAELADPRIVFDPRYLMPHLVSNLPFLAALAAHLWLRTRGIAVGFPLAQLLVFPALFLIGQALSVNTGRVVSMATVIYLAYEMRVLEAIVAQAASRGAAPTRPAFA